MIKIIGLFLLMLLKILGGLLLVLLLVLTVALLLVSFVPVRYDILVQNEKTADPNPVKNIQVQVKVSWLVHLIHVTVSYGPDGLANQIKAAGIDVQKALAWFSNRKEARRSRRKARKQKKSEKAGKPGREQSTGTDVSQNRVEESESTGDLTETRQKQVSESSQPGQPSAQQDLENSQPEQPLAQQDLENSQPEQFSTQQDLENNREEQPFAQQDLGNIQPGLQREQPAEEQGLYAAGSGDESVKNTTEHKKRRRKKKSGKGAHKKTFRKKEPRKKPKTEKKESHSGKQGGIREKLRQFHKEYRDETNRHAVSQLWKELCHLLRHYKPRKLKADLTFSLSDPALTGNVLGIISLMPAVYRYPCSIIPDFESDKLYMEGCLIIQGKVTVYVFLLSLLRLIRDKEFMKTVKRLMKRG